MTFNLVNIVFEFLKQNPDQKFTTNEIAQWILDTYPEKCHEKQKRSTAKVVPLDNDEALLYQLVLEINALRARLQKRYPDIKTTGLRPKKYYFDTSNSGATLAESQLYEALSQFLWSEFKIYSKRIRENYFFCDTPGLGMSHWLNPNMVGLESLNQGWHQAIQDCAEQRTHKEAKLWSFEMKVLIHPANVRSAFFQTLSNSSWANLGYLVTSEIEDLNTLKELRLLANLYGIGLIQINVEKPSESQILIPAKERTPIDWETADHFAEANKDFMACLKLVRAFYETGEIKPADWEPIKTV